MRGTASEVTLWAVDYGVLSLTAFRTPDVLGSIYMRKALQVVNADNRQRIISRRVLTPKGSEEGGGGGEEAGPAACERTSARWRSGSDRSRPTPRPRLGRRQAPRVADDLPDHGGRGRQGVAIRIGGERDPHQQAGRAAAGVPAVPRRGDSATSAPSSAASSGAAGTPRDHAQPRSRGADDRRQRSPDGAGRRRRIVEVRFHGDGAGGRPRARPDVGQARRARTTASRKSIPVEILAPSETVAAYGEAVDRDQPETLACPPASCPASAASASSSSSTALVGLGEGARYLVEYPYGCVEQQIVTRVRADARRGSRRGVQAAGDRPARSETAQSQAELKELETLPVRRPAASRSGQASAERVAVLDELRAAGLPSRRRRSSTR